VPHLVLLPLCTPTHRAAHMEGSRRRGLFCDSRISLEDADLLKEGCAGQTTSHRLRWASYGPVGPLSYTMYYVHMCITHITCASRWSSIHLASPSHSSTSPIASQLVFSRSLVFFGPALPPTIMLLSCASGTFQPTLRTERVAPNLARLVLT
jgi:hypothetical protein